VIGSSTRASIRRDRPDAISPKRRRKIDSSAYAVLGNSGNLVDPAREEFIHAASDLAVGQRWDASTAQYSDYPAHIHSSVTQPGCRRMPQVMKSENLQVPSRHAERNPVCTSVCGFPVWSFTSSVSPDSNWSASNSSFLDLPPPRCYRFVTANVTHVSR